MDDLKASYLGDWVFHYNPHAELWAAIPRDSYNEYWSVYTHPSILRSKKLETLLSLLNKSKGDVKVIEKLVSGKNK